MRKSLRYKLLRNLLVPLTLLWLVRAVFSYSFALNFANVATDRALFDSTHALAEQVRLVNGKVTVQLPRIALEMFLSDQRDLVYYRVADQNGQLVTGDSAVPNPPEQANTGAPIVHDGSIRGKKVRVASLYLAAGDNQKILVQTAETLNKRRKLADEILNGMILPQLAWIVMAALIIWHGVGRGLLPLKRLREEISSRSHRDLSPVHEADVPQEISPIIHAINELMARVGTALEIQQRFIANAAHQLRTPLAGLRTQTELALRENDPKQIRHALQQLNTSSKQAIRLVNQLLALAKVEPEADRTMEFVPFDLNALVKERVTEWIPRALNKKIDLGLEGAHEPVWIKGNSIQLNMLLDNLIDNAIRYSPAGSHVTVRVEQEEQAVLTVEDNGPGIQPDERDRVFQRFYRILDMGGEGSGLGLAIVQEIAHLHHAEVSISCPPNGIGTIITVVFQRVTE